MCLMFNFVNPLGNDDIQFHKLPLPTCFIFDPQEVLTQQCKEDANAEVATSRELCS